MPAPCALRDGSMHGWVILADALYHTHVWVDILSHNDPNVNILGIFVPRIGGTHLIFKYSMFYIKSYHGRFDKFSAFVQCLHCNLNYGQNKLLLFGMKTMCFTTPRLTSAK